MLQQFEIAKGIHPGFIIERELHLRKLSKQNVSRELGVQPQTLEAIIGGKRRINTNLALKIEKFLDFDEGTLMILQAWHDVERGKKKQAAASPDLTQIRKVLFWDTNINTIHWDKYKQAVIKRVFERGNEPEKNEIIRFYGKQTVEETLRTHV